MLVTDYERSEWLRMATAVAATRPDIAARMRNAAQCDDLRAERWLARGAELSGPPNRWVKGHIDQPRIELQDDPRGPVLLMRLPGESEASGV